MSCKAFAEELNIGGALLDRWENRKLFQNPQADVLLRLLADPQIGCRVQSWTDMWLRNVADSEVKKMKMTERKYPDSMFR
jgi:hypothetical protein